MGHYIELVIEDGAPKVRFRCDYPEDAFCRRWPLDKNVEEWFEDEPLDAGGHQCSTEAWIEDLGIEEGAEVTITPRPPEGPLSVGDYLPANVVWVP